MHDIIKKEEYEPLSEIFKAFSDETRLRILSALSCGETSVGELALHLKMSDSAISHQLKTLKSARLVKGRREGKQIYYSLNDDHVKTMLVQGLEHVRE